MKIIRLISIGFAFTIFWGAILPAEATLLGPLTQQEFLNLNDSDADYGPPPAIGFPDGPTSVQSGEDVTLYYGPSPGQNNVEALLFVISYDPTLSSLDGGTISFQFDSDSVSFDSTNFYSTTETGFPVNIAGIGNGEVGGVKFPDALHAGVIYDPFSGGSTGDGSGIVNIISAV